MTVGQILLLALLAILVNRVKTWRSSAMLCASSLAIYWLQPYQEPVNLIFWFPTMTLAVVVVFWLLTSTPEVRSWNQNWIAIVVLAGVILLVDLSRYINFDFLIVADTPRPQWVFIVILVTLGAGLLILKAKKYSSVLLLFAIVGVIGLLIFIKIPSVSTGLVEGFSSLRGKDAAISGLTWLGFSYVCFRLLHTAFDRLAGRLPPVNLADYMNYVIFFPAFTAGPMDRLERFVRALNQPMVLDQSGWMEAGTRLITGMVKKFILADSLVLFALNEMLVKDVRSAGWVWVMLYAFSFRIFFDFSGYTDIALGLARLVGIRLPENFDRPYFKTNLSQFWNSWHMTLTQWFRSYFFNPATRLLKSSNQRLPGSLALILTQVSTMVLIGLWHGVTINYLLWGLWHGIGLFIQNRWSEWVRVTKPSWVNVLGKTPLKLLNVFLTFHFVTIGWLFFIFSEPALVWVAINAMVGLK